MSRPDADHDPGWGPVARLLPRLVVPMLGMRTMSAQADGLLSLRMVWAVFLWSLVVIWAVIAVLFSAHVELGGALAPSTVLVGVIAVGVAAQLLAARFAPEPAFGSEAALAASFQTATLMRIGAAEFAGLLGLVGFVLSGSLLVYGVGFVIALAGHLDAMPGRRRLQLVQERADAAGSGLRVVASLRSHRLSR